MVQNHLQMLVIIGILTNLGVSAVEPPPPTTDDPTDLQESQQLQEHTKNKSIKSKEYAATEAQRIAHGRYMKGIKTRCDKIKAEQHERIRTEIPCLLPPYMVSVYGAYSEENERFVDYSLMPDDDFVLTAKPEYVEPKEKLIENCVRKMPKEEKKYRAFMKQLYNQPLDNQKYSLADLENMLNKAEAEMGELIRLFNNKYFLRRLGIMMSYYKDLTVTRYFKVMTPLVIEFNDLRIVSVTLKQNAQKYQSTQSDNDKYTELVTRIGYINQMMMHNFVIIADLNVHLLAGKRRHQDCIIKVQSTAPRKPRFSVGEIIILTIILTILGALAAYVLVAFVAFIVLITALCWPITVGVVGMFAATVLTVTVIEGISLLKSQQKYYIAPNPKYTALITRKKPFTSKLTDFFRG